MAGSVAGAFFKGSKPKIPEYPLLDIEGEQNAAISGNLKNLPQISTLAARVNQLTAEEFDKQAERFLPGYGALRDSGTAAIQRQLSGEIPDDVAREIRRHTTEQSVAGGYGGSEFARNLTARDLGLTSLEITNRALDSASRWMAHARSAPQFDFTSMFVSPQQRFQIRLFENQQTFSRNLLKNRVDAMPEPWETAVANFFDNIEESGQAALGAYAGKAMGGGGGGGMSGAGHSGGAMGYGDSAYGATVDQARQMDFQTRNPTIDPGPAAMSSYQGGFQYQQNYNGAPAWWP